MHQVKRAEKPTYFQESREMSELRRQSRGKAAGEKECCDTVYFPFYEIKIVCRASHPQLVKIAIGFSGAVPRHTA